MNVVTAYTGIKGHYTLEVTRADGSLRRKLEFDNLITDQGLDIIGAPMINNVSYGQPYINTHCEVGTGNAAPAFADVGCLAPLAMFPPSGSTNIEGGTLSQVAGPPPYWRCVWVYQFAQGAAAGNLTEVVVGNTAPGDIHVRAFSRALILDGAGNPTVLVVQPTEFLKVTYELRLYFDTADTPISFNISGVTHTGIIRRSSTTTNPQMYYGQTTHSFGIQSMTVYNGALGLTSAVPSGSIDQVNCGTADAYIPGSHYRDFQAFFDLSVGNGNISAIRFLSPHGSWQYSVDPVIPKDNTKQLTLKFRAAWGRYAP
jgi:hypothetical protein